MRILVVLRHIVGIRVVHVGSRFLELRGADRSLELVGIQTQLLIAIQPKTDLRLDRAAVKPSGKLPVLVRLKEDPVKAVAADRFGRRLDRTPVAILVLGLLHQPEARIAGRKRRHFTAAVDQPDRDPARLEVGHRLVQEGDKRDRPLGPPCRFAKVERVVIAWAEAPKGVSVGNPTADRIDPRKPSVRSDWHGRRLGRL